MNESTSQLSSDPQSSTPAYRCPVKRGTFISWQNMLIRCTKSSHKQTRDYKGRGITVCERWLSFQNFLADMGLRPTGMTLDRKKNDEGYYPENCRWATRNEQARNRRSNLRIEFGGEKLALVEVADRLKVPYSALMWRVRNWPLQRALSEQLKPDRRRSDRHGRE